MLTTQQPTTAIPLPRSPLRGGRLHAYLAESSNCLLRYLVSGQDLRRCKATCPPTRAAFTLSSGFGQGASVGTHVCSFGQSSTYQSHCLRPTVIVPSVTRKCSSLSWFLQSPVLTILANWEFLTKWFPGPPLPEKMQTYQNKNFGGFFILKTLNMSKYSVSHPEGGNLVISQFLVELGFLGNTNVQNEYCQLAVFSNMRNNTSHGEWPRTAFIWMTQQNWLSRSDSNQVGRVLQLLLSSIPAAASRMVSLAVEAEEAVRQ